jgi:DNA segregation ATPase FtsK/SpoIIIE-like protein
VIDSLSPRTRRRVLGVLLGALAIFAACALALPGAGQATGPMGQALGRSLEESFGPVGAWMLPLLLALWAVNRLRESSLRSALIATAFVAGATIVVASALALLHDPLATSGGRPSPQLPGDSPRALAWGGTLGVALAGAAHGGLGAVGAHLVVWTAALVFLLVGLEIAWPAPVARLASRLAARMAGGAAGVASVLRARAHRLRAAREHRAVRGPATRASDRFAPGETADAEMSLRPARDLPRAMSPASEKARCDEEDGDVAVQEALREPRATVRPARRTPAKGDGPEKSPRAKNRTAVPVEEDLPPATMLLCAPPGGEAIDEQEIAAAGQLLEQRLRDFGVEGRVVQAHPGPVITTYEIEPAPGVRVSSFVSRADDLALALRVARVRIVAPLPGRGAVGVEVPNKKPQLVRLGDVVQSSEFTASTAALPLPLGFDTAGRPVATDLAKMPHLLVAGATGAGKSTCINTMLAGLLLRRRTSELRLVLVDPKMLELSAYAGVPHLLMPVVTEIKKEAPKALFWLVQEMEDRYRLLAARGARNIDSYNKSLRRDEPSQPLPYIVVVIDELADLMLVAGRDVEEPIARLAQMARAVGIHLIIATQRPSVDVITGVIKANFPSRIAFQVASKVDSRTILDVNGAESLLGRGDMLFLPGGRADPLRVHGAYISEEETDAIVTWLKENVPAPPSIDLDAALRRSGGEDAPGEVDDDLFDEAARLVLTHRLGSTSFLQRRLKVGYSRAGRLMDLLEEQGVVGPGDGSKPREVLIELEDWQARRGALEDL